MAKIVENITITFDHEQLQWFTEEFKKIFDRIGEIEYRIDIIGPAIDEYNLNHQKEKF